MFNDVSKKKVIGEAPEAAFTTIFFSISGVTNHISICMHPSTCSSVDASSFLNVRS
jgi:hypothetical protein